MISQRLEMSDASSEDAVRAEYFGADMLRFRKTDGFKAISSESGITSVRWPGEGIVDPVPLGTSNASDDRWINSYNSDGSVGEYTYDLKHSNIISTMGWPREGLSEALSFAVAENLAFTMLVPEDRYINLQQVATDGEGSYLVDFDQIIVDVSLFLDRLLDGHFGKVPADFCLQIGQEYYTGAIQNAVESQGLSHTQRVKALGEYYNFVASFVSQYVHQKTMRGENPQDVSVKISVQMGRFFADGDAARNPIGSFEDVKTFIDQFDAYGLSSVDSLLFQRYVPKFNGVNDGLSEPANGHQLIDALELWSRRAYDLGVSSIETVRMGWAKSSFTREEAKINYDGTLSQQEFEQRSNREFEAYYLETLSSSHDYGERLPSTMLQFLSEAIWAGVDEAFYYGFDLNQAGALSRNDVDGRPVLLIGGTTFAVLSDAITGMKTSGDFFYNSRVDSSIANTFVFFDNSEVELFISPNEILDHTASFVFDLTELVRRYGPLSLVATEAIRAEVSPDWRQQFGVVDLDEIFGMGFQEAEAQVFTVAQKSGSGSLPTADAIWTGLYLEGIFEKSFEVNRFTFQRTVDHQVFKELTGFAWDEVQIQFGNDLENAVETQREERVVFAGAGMDTIVGGGGIDVLDGGSGADLLNGEDGFDYSSYFVATDGVLVDLLSEELNTGDAEGDQFVSIEGLWGSSFADDIRGNGDRNILLGGFGSDILHGRGGADRLVGGRGDDLLLGGAGEDTLDGGDGIDRASYWSSNSGILADLQVWNENEADAKGDRYFSVENLQGSDFEDDLRGDGSSNSIWSGDGDDIIHGRSGRDRIFGQAGDDIILGGEGPDTIDGGHGVDRAAYWSSKKRVTADLSFSALNEGDASGDVFVSIEYLQGSSFDDDLRGDGKGNFIWAGRGDDVVFGRDGNDTIFGQGGNDTLVGGYGADNLHGGDGIDRVSYWNAKSHVVVDLVDKSNNSGEAKGDILTSIEDIQGSSYDDRIRGGVGDNRIWGGFGDDTLTGGEGNDFLIGGDGRDNFVFLSGNDTIADFQPTIDVLSVSGKTPQEVQLALSTAQYTETFIRISFSGGSLELKGGEILNLHDMVVMFGEELF